MSDKLKTLAFRWNAREVMLVKRVSHLRGEDSSSFCRRAVKAQLIKLGYGNAAEAKALGIEGDGNID